MTEAQLRQRREAGRLGGLALAAKVEPDYFKWLGRRGGRRFMFNLLIHISRTWEFSPEIMEYCRVSEAKQAAIVADMREHYRQEAYEKYHDFTGNMVMLELFQQ